MNTNRNSDKIRTLNDSFRQTFIGGRVMKTDGVTGCMKQHKKSSLPR